MPVLPDVGSIRVSPGFILPSLSATSIICFPILSLIEPPGLKNSHLAYSSQSNLLPTLFNFTIGVSPTVSNISLSIIFLIHPYILFSLLTKINFYFL